MASTLAARTSWEELQRIVADGSTEALATLGRSEEQLATYRAHKERVRQQPAHA